MLRRRLDRAEDGKRAKHAEVALHRAAAEPREAHQVFLRRAERAIVAGAERAGPRGLFDRLFKATLLDAGNVAGGHRPRSSVPRAPASRGCVWSESSSERGRSDMGRFPRAVRAIPYCAAHAVAPTLLTITRALPSVTLTGRLFPGGLSSSL